MAVSGQYGAKTPTTNIWDPSQIPQDLDPVLKEFFLRMYQNLNLMSNVLNVAEIGQYTNQFETVNGNQWFPNPANNSSTVAKAIQRPVFRTTINFGALPAAVKSVNHNIGITNPSPFTFTRIYGVASDTVNRLYIPLPYASPTLNENIKVDVTATQVTITTGIDRSNYNVCYIVLEYIKF
jgi:hypothetical protein